jgi:predicted nucleic acid-binding protein
MIAMLVIHQHGNHSWGRQHVEQPVPVADALIAATAKVRGWIVVTRNAKDFERPEVQVLNPSVD